MVSDFIEEHVGYFRLTPTEFAVAQALSHEITNEARQIIEYGQNGNGYSTRDKLQALVQISTRELHTSVNIYLTLVLTSRQNCQTRYFPGA